MNVLLAIIGIIAILSPIIALIIHIIICWGDTGTSIDEYMR